MGSQIAIAQAAQDEAEAVQFLQQRHRFVAVPRVLSGPEVQAVELGRCEAVKQLFFLAEDADKVLGHIRQLTDRPGEHQVDRGELRGLFIEWNRTVWEREGEAQAGRFYFDRPSPPHDPSARIMDATMRQLTSWIKKSYPLRSDRRHPTYVGPHLSEMVRAGRARVVYPNGSAVKLVENA